MKDRVMDMLALVVSVTIYVVVLLLATCLAFAAIRAVVTIFGL